VASAIQSAPRLAGPTVLQSPVTRREHIGNGRIERHSGHNPQRLALLGPVRPRQVLAEKRGTQVGNEVRTLEALGTRAERPCAYGPSAVAGAVHGVLGTPFDELRLNRHGYARCAVRKRADRLTRLLRA